MRKDFWKEGDYNAICDGCGFQFKASELKERYDGCMVCPDDWEPRHPSERSLHIRTPKTLPWTRPEGDDVFLEGVCTALGRQGISGYAVSGCAVSGLNLGLKDT